MNKIFTQLTKNRHLTPDFISPKYENLEDPDSLPDMKKALKRIEKAIKTGEKVLIYGDYDVDGVTASTLMEQALKMAGLTEVEIMLPDRFVDGYGMSERLIKRAKKDQITLVITVDCGSRNHAIIDELNHENIDTIVTDHHECEDTIPDAVAVINPHRHDYQGPADLKNLAGVGVAFKLAQGLVKAGKIKEGQEKWLLDLVLLGTICDSMLLSGENRILTYFGKIVLEKTKRPGLIELKKTAKVKTITSESIGFGLGPRLNSAGRLETAEISLNLLRTTSVTEAAKLAAKLEELNQKRRKEQREAVKEITENLKNTKEDTPVIIQTGNWHEGILGIVAGRLVEEYHKPAFVLTEVDGGIYKGSGRSFGEFNLANALEAAKDTIIGGGGHAAAAGLQLKQENLYQFREKINAYYKNLNLKDQERFLKNHADLDIENLTDFNLELLENLHQLEPFGPGNEEPIFCLKYAHIIESKKMGQDQNHLRLDLQGKDHKIIKTVAFFAPENWFSLYDDEAYNFLIKPVENEWNGVRSTEARLIDIIE
ncbi:MAG: single-stranded-DNA-specific exonuclease RecJ [Candidatus Saccharibacteria bacterium]|nr:single-stranded-DNA-specific exonuclease RecJ [Candidatus Saccharibacteria bacterium]